MRVVTKRGDKGMTSTLDGRRVSKASNEIEFVGTIDELQSFLGILPRTDEIEEIQRELYKIMAGEAGDVSIIDSYIESMHVPNITSFVIPTGWTHVCRTVCRRAERISVICERDASRFLNRLSDYLYILTLQ